MSGFETSMSVPLDDDGFLRRGCPTCEREFKWLASEQDANEPVADEGHFCPYCGVQSGVDTWWTEAQIAAIHGKVYEEAVRPELEKFERDVESMGAGGLFDVR